LLQDREPGADTTRQSGQLNASVSRRSPRGTSCHTPRCRHPSSAEHGIRCLCSAGSATTDATPGRLKSTIQDSPGAHHRQSQSPWSDSRGRVGGGLAQLRPSRVPLNPSIIMAVAPAQGHVTRSAIPLVEPPCFHHSQQGVPCKPCASLWPTKSHAPVSSMVLQTDPAEVLVSVLRVAKENVL